MNWSETQLKISEVELELKPNLFIFVFLKVIENQFIIEFSVQVSQIFIKTSIISVYSVRSFGIVLSSKSN